MKIIDFIVKKDGETQVETRDSVVGPVSMRADSWKRRSGFVPDHERPLSFTKVCRRLTGLSKFWDKILSRARSEVENT